MYQLFTVELYKIFKRPRTYISFGAIAAFILVLQLGLKADGKEFLDFILGDLSNSFKIEGNLLNGYVVCFFILQLLLFHIPLLVVIIGGDMFSGEANMGTLRLLLSKPITRTQFVLGKFFATCVYTILLLLWFAFLSLFISILLFGTGDILHFKNDYLVQISVDDILWRYVYSFGFAALSLITIAALSFFISIFAENSIGPIVATMCVIILSTIFNTMSIPSFVAIKPYLFTSYLTGWRDFFDVRVDADNNSIIGSIQKPQQIIKSILVLTAHIVGFVLLSIYCIKKKDVLS